MTYTVLWLPAAEAELTQLWLEGEDRVQIGKAANRLDDWLRTDPIGASESRANGVRIVFSAPLAATFTVLEEDRIVRIREVWYYQHST